MQTCQSIKLKKLRKSIRSRFKKSKSLRLKSKSRLSKSKSLRSKVKSLLSKSKSRRLRSKSRSLRSKSKSKKHLGFFRKSYTRSNGVHVKTMYVNTFNKKSPKSGNVKVIPKLKQGTLRQFGYSSLLSDDLRHKALQLAIKKYGAGTIAKKLNAVFVLSRNRSPEIASKFYKDRVWVSSQK